MWSGEVSRKVRRERGSEGCEGLRRGGSTFIGWRGAAGARMRSTMATVIGTAKGHGEVRVM
jgi:hypothetical protein